MKEKYTFFWQTKYSFSNWHNSRFTYKGEQFENSEAAFMWEKAILFNDTDIAEEILLNQDPRDVKALGRKVENFDGKVWDDNKFNIMFEVNLAKFKQCKHCKKALLEAEGKFCESSPYDRIWGCGLRENEASKVDPKDWPGENLLGKVLDKVKENILSLEKFEKDLI